MIRFSIVIACYNQRAFIRDAVGSALAQTDPDREVIVVDDASTDGTPELLKEYGGAITLIALPANGGACATRNAGAAAARGQFLVFLDGDDVLLPWALRIYRRIIDLKDPKVLLGKMVWFNHPFSPAVIPPAPEEISVVEYDAFCHKDRPWRASASALVVERQTFEASGRWSAGIFPMEDHDLTLKLGCSGRAVLILGPQTTAYRWHSANTTGQIQRLFDSNFNFIQRERDGFYPGGRAWRADRCAVIGGVTFHWFKAALKAGRYGAALGLLARGYPMVWAAIARRAAARLRGRRPVETLTMA